MADREAARAGNPGHESSAATAEDSTTSVGPAHVPGQPKYVVRWAKGGDYCRRCSVWDLDLTGHEPCEPPGVPAGPLRYGVTTYTLDYGYGPDWECLGLVGSDYRGFKRIELRHTFHGLWSCVDCERLWLADVFGPVCAECGGYGIPPGLKRPRRRPPTETPSPAQVVRRLDGMRIRLRQTPEADRVALLGWMAGVVAEMLILDDLHSVAAALRALDADAEALGMEREEARQAIVAAFQKYGLLLGMAA